MLSDKLVAYIKQTLRQLWASQRGYRIRGLPPVVGNIVSTIGAPRLNIVIIGIRREASFGGADTALRLMWALEPFFPRVRIIVLGETDEDFEALSWPGWELDSQTPDSAKTIAFLRRAKSTPAFEPNDYFLATHWMTARFVRGIRKMQQAATDRKLAPFIYLLQDFEPSFYPWSGRYLLASSTYTPAKDIIAVFNTQLLRDYFELAGYTFGRSYVFEPCLNPKLAEYRTKVPSHRKKKLLLIYGRPSTARNAFDLVVETLILWSQTFQNAADWKVISLGEKHRNIRLANGLVLRAGGKLSLDAYAECLLDASVGLSLMVSPHPSYPPLEMAEFGVHVVTNAFANKNLSNRSSNIVSVTETTPEAIASALTACCESFEAGTAQASQKAAFLGEKEEFPFARSLAFAVRESEQENKAIALAHNVNEEEIKGLA